MNYRTSVTQNLRYLRTPPETVDGDAVVRFAFFLTALLVGCVPIVAITTGVPTLALVGAAGLLYGATLLATENVFEGLASAVFVLVTFYADVPLIELPVGVGYTSPQLNLLLVDLVVLPFVGLLCWWLYAGEISVSFSRKWLAGYALFGFVGWALLSALVGNGPSRLGAVFYVVAQLRYLLLFVIGAVVVRRIGIHRVVYALGIAILGQLAYAIAEVLNGGSFGLTRLGDSSGGLTQLFYVGPFRFETSLYAGGFVGPSRALVALLLLVVVPLSLLVIVRRSLPWKLAGAIALAVSIFLVRVSESDAAWAAFLLTALLMGIALCYLWISTETTRTTRPRAFDYVLGIGSTVGAIAFSVLLFFGRDVSASPDETTTSNGGPSTATQNSPNGGLSGGTGAVSEHNPVLWVIDLVPLIEAANVSVRLRQYVAAVDIALQYPLFGIGGMNFPLVAESYGLSKPMAIHSTYFGILASTGIPGVVLFVVSITVVLLVATRNACSPGTDRLLWAMLVCGMLGFHAYAFWVTIHFGGVSYLVFWVLAGAVVGASRRTEETGRSDSVTT